MLARGAARGACRLQAQQATLLAHGRALSVASRANITPLGQYGGVHGSRVGQKLWRNKPLFRREGDARFRTGNEAASMLVDEVKFRDAHEKEFVQTFEHAMETLAPVFDRIPKYAFVAKGFLQPERIIQFRVSWRDDANIYRINRGFRVQYSSALGPFEGGLHFHKDFNTSILKSMACARVFTNALTGCNLGAAVGGADFNPANKSEAEVQRFCEAFMTEMAKYIGSDQDIPGVGLGVGSREIGYLYGQYHRNSVHHAQKGRGLLWGGVYPFPQATAWGVVHFARRALEEKGDSIKGKRCLITGSGKMALHCAEKLIELGAVPLTLSDSSGHIYEPDGIDASKLKTIMKIKSERGARIGRYIVASTTAKYNEPENVFSVPCDLVFPCAQHNVIDATAATMLADMGCQGVFEGSHMPSTNEAIKVFKKRGLSYGGHIATLAMDSLFNGLELQRRPLPTGDPALLDERIREAVDLIYEESKAAAKEYNIRGDITSGAVIAGFLKVADVMVAHGAV